MKSPLIACLIHIFERNYKIRKRTLSDWTNEYNGFELVSGGEMERRRSWVTLLRWFFVSWNLLSPRARNNKRGLSNTFHRLWAKHLTTGRMDQFSLTPSQPRLFSMSLSLYSLAQVCASVKGQTLVFPGNSVITVYNQFSHTTTHMNPAKIMINHSRGSKAIQNRVENVKPF